MANPPTNRELYAMYGMETTWCRPCKGTGRVKVNPDDPNPRAKTIKCEECEECDGEGCHVISTPQSRHPEDFYNG